MASLADCLKKTGKYMGPEDVADIERLTQEAIDAGMPEEDAVFEAISAVQGELRAARDNILEQLAVASPEVEAFLADQQEALDVEEVGAALAEELGITAEEVAPEPEAAPAPEPTPEEQLTDEHRKKFDDMLNGTTRRADWANHMGLPNELVDALVDEALGDGRLTLREGQPVRARKRRETSALLLDDMNEPIDNADVMADIETGRRINLLPTQVERNYARALVVAGIDTVRFRFALNRLMAEKGLSTKQIRAIATAFIGPGVKIPNQRRAAFLAINAEHYRRVNEIREAQAAGHDIEFVPSNVHMDESTMAALTDMARKMTGDQEFDIQFQGLIELAGGKRASGAWNGATRTLLIALAKGADNAITTLHHEIVHALKDIGVLKGEKWETLKRLKDTKPSKEEALFLLAQQVDRNKIPLRRAKELAEKAGDITYMEIYDIRRRYTDFMKAEAAIRGATLTDAALEEKLTEELVADVAADWRDTHSFGTPADRVLRSIADFFKKLYNKMVLGGGFNTVDSVFASIYSGQLAIDAAKRKAAPVMEKKDTIQASLEGEQEQELPNYNLEFNQSKTKFLALGMQKRGQVHEIESYFINKGAKKTELLALGLTDLFNKKRAEAAKDGTYQSWVTRDEVFETIRANNVDIKEVEYFGSEYLYDMAREEQEAIEENEYDVEFDEETQTYYVTLYGDEAMDGFNSEDDANIFISDSLSQSSAELSDTEILDRLGMRTLEGNKRGGEANYAAFGLSETDQDKTYKEVAVYLNSLPADRPVKQRHSELLKELSKSSSLERGEEIQRELVALTNQRNEILRSQGFDNGHFGPANVVGHVMMSTVSLPATAIMPDNQLSALTQRLKDGLGFESDFDFKNAGVGIYQQAIDKGIASQDEMDVFAYMRGWDISIGPLREQLSRKKIGKAKHLDQVQSDWGQKFRDNVRNSISLELFGKPFSKLFDMVDGKKIPDRQKRNAVSKLIEKRRKAGTLTQNIDSEKIAKLEGELSDLQKKRTDGVLEAYRQIHGEIDEQNGDQRVHRQGWIRNALSQLIYDFSARDLQEKIDKAQADVDVFGDAYNSTMARLNDLNKRRDERNQGLRQDPDGSEEYSDNQEREWLQRNARTEGNAVNRAKDIIHDMKQKLEFATWLQTDGLFSGQPKSNLKKIEDDIRRVGAELKATESIVNYNPLIGDTDTWVRFLLKRFLRHAIGEEISRVVVPSGETVLRYNPGEEEGMEYFYDEIVTRNMKEILESYDPATPEAVETDTLKDGFGTHHGGSKRPYRGYVYTITPDAKKKITAEGLGPLFSLDGDAFGRNDAGIESVDPNQRPDGDHADRISTRYPVQVRSTEDPIIERLKIDMDAMRQNPEAFRFNSQIVKKYRIFPKGFKSNNPDAIMEAYKEIVKENLLWLHNSVPLEVRSMSKRWYDGARILTERWAYEFNVPPRAVAGVLAALSPGKGWPANVSMGERLMDIYTSKQKHAWDKDMEKMSKQLYKGKAALLTVRKRIQNKTLGELLAADDHIGAAAWIRLYDETHNEVPYRTINTEGMFIGEATGKVAWQSFALIAKAVEIMSNPEYAVISRAMGEMHKIRNFYNNILAPNAPWGDVTIDTHAIAAAMLLPLAQKSTEVAHGLGTNPGVGIQNVKAAGISGAKGLYGLYADAYREAAAELGILPRELQSITWEALKGLYSPAFKRNKAHLKEIDKIWKEVKDGKETIDGARSRVLAYAGGIADPEWIGPGGAIPSVTGTTSYDGELPGARVQRAERRGARARNRRNGTGDVSRAGVLKASLEGDANNQRRARDELGFYSAALEAAKGIKQQKGSVQQMLNPILEAAGKEAREMKLDKAFSGQKSVTKEEIIRYIEKNQTVLTEKRYGGSDSDIALEQAANAAMHDEASTFSIEQDERGIYVTRLGRRVRDPYTGENRYFETERDANRFIRDQAWNRSGRIEPEDLKARYPQYFSDRPNDVDGPAKYKGYSIDTADPTYREHTIQIDSSQMEQELEDAEYDLRDQLSALAAEQKGMTPEQLKESKKKYAQIVKEMQDIQLRRIEVTSNPFYGHFPERDIVGHMQIGLAKIEEDRDTQVVSQFQSDWSQRLRDGGGFDLQKIADLEKQLEDMGAPSTPNLFNGFMQEIDYLGFDSQARMFAELHAIKRKGDNWRDYYPITPGDEKAYDAIDSMLENEHDIHRIWGELNAARSAPRSHPLVDTTDQWLKVILRRFLNVAALENKVKYLAIPKGDTVLSYNPGDTDVFLADRIVLKEEKPTSKSDKDPYNPQKWRKGTDPEYTLMAYGDDGNRTYKVKGERKLAKLLTKPVAEALLGAAMKKGVKTLTADQGKTLRIGGHGMVEFYDSIVPKALAKLLARADKNSPRPKFRPSVETYTKKEASRGALYVPEGDFGWNVFEITDTAREWIEKNAFPKYSLDGYKSQDEEADNAIERQERIAEWRNPLNQNAPAKRYGQRTWYHGTTHTIAAFDGPVWLTDSPTVAHDYADRSALRRALEEQDPDDLYEVGELDEIDVSYLDSIAPGLQEYVANQSGRNIIPAMVRLEKTLDMTKLGADPTLPRFRQFMIDNGIWTEDVSYEDLQNELLTDYTTTWKMIEDLGVEADIEAAGYDSYVINDVSASTRQKGVRSHIALRVLDASRVRSPNAEFNLSDEAMKSADLMASLDGDAHKRRVEAAGFDPNRVLYRGKPKDGDPIGAAKIYMYGEPGEGREPVYVRGDLVRELEYREQFFRLAGIELDMADEETRITKSHETNRFFKAQGKSGVQYALTDKTGKYWYTRFVAMFNEADVRSTRDPFDPQLDFQFSLEGGDGRRRTYHWTPVPEKIGTFNPFTHFGTARAANERFARPAGNLSVKEIEMQMKSPGSVVAGGTFPVDLDMKNPLRIEDTGVHNPASVAFDIAVGLRIKHGADEAPVPRDLVEEVLQIYFENMTDHQVLKLADATDNSWYLEEFDVPADQASEWLRDFMLSDIVGRIDRMVEEDYSRRDAGALTYNELFEIIPPDEATWGHLSAVLKDFGHDGLVYKNIAEDEGKDSYIATQRGTVTNAMTGETMYSLFGKSDPDAATLNSAITKLKKALGINPTQTIFGTTLTVGDRTMRLRPPKGQGYQYRSDTGAVGVSKSRDMKSIARAGGYALEARIGGPLHAIMQKFKTELVPPGSLMPEGKALTDGFARWFERYVMDRKGAAQMAPNFFVAFEEMLDAESPTTLQQIDAATAEYEQWRSRASVDELASDVVSTYRANDWKTIDDSNKNFAETTNGYLAQAYTGIIDDLSPVKMVVRRLLNIADRAGLKDAQGRPISLKVAENAYKRAQMIRGSHAAGYAYLTDGISSYKGGDIRFQPLQKAIDILMAGKEWDKVKAQDFGQYLISRRAVEEYARLDAKKAEIARIEKQIENDVQTLRKMQEAQTQEGNVLERRRAQLTRVEAQVRMRQSDLRKLAKEDARLQSDLDGVRGDISEALDAIDDGSDVARTVRDRLVRRQRLMERRSANTRRARERLEQELDLRTTEEAQLRAEVNQLTDKTESRQVFLDAFQAGLNDSRKMLDRTKKAGATRPPTLESKDWHMDFIDRMEKDPRFSRIQEAAQVVYDFNYGLLTLRWEAGLIPDDLYYNLSKRRHYYVPFLRDMTDITGDTFSNTNGNRAWSPFQKFEGSDRAILNPLETISQEAYRTAQHIAMNDMVNSLASLAERVGPGGANIAQVLDMQTSEPEAFEKIVEVAMEHGMDYADAVMVAYQMEVDFTSLDLDVIWSPVSKGPKSPPTLPLWRNGKRTFVMLTDAQFGQDVVNAMKGIGKEQMNIIAETIIGAPSRALQIGVTTSPTFMPRNLIRDMFDAWIKVGALPIVAQAQGAMIMSGRSMAGLPEDFMRKYMEAGGITGGRNVAALGQKEQQLKVLDLDPNKTSTSAIAMGAIAGAVLGTIVAGPMGTLIGGALMGYGTRKGQVLKIVESVETMTRIGVAAHAYKEAKRNNPDLTEQEAILEGAYIARDVFDWNRRGSKMLVILRSVTFLNAQIQGLDKAGRSMAGAGDRGSAVGAEARRLMGIVFKNESGIELSADEQRDLANAYKTWMRLGLYTMALMALYALAMDDPDYEDIKDRTKATHSWLPNWLGTDIRIPKAFEWAIPANIAEALYDAYAGRDPRFVRRIADSTYEVMVPPVVPQAFTLVAGYTTKRQVSSLTDDARPIIPSWEEGIAPELQFGNYTSWLARDVAKIMANVGIPESKIPSPYMIDFTLRTGGYWGTDLARAYSYAREAMSGMPGREARPPDWPVIGGFTGYSARQSRSVEEFYNLMSKQGGYFFMTADAYDRYQDKHGKKDEAMQYLSRKPIDQREYALLQYHGTTDQKKKHPLNRLQQLNGVIAGISKDVIADTLTTGKARGRQLAKTGGQIEIDAKTKTAIIDTLEKLRRIEAWNTMVYMRRPGWENRAERDAAPLLETLKAVSPVAHKAFNDRVREASVRDWKTVKRDWPALGQSMLRYYIAPE